MRDSEIADRRSSEACPLVSVIIPTFNRRDSVLRALESVARQTYPTVEVIVADDCSTDGTVEAIAQRQFRMPVHIVRLPENQGPASARNSAITQAGGKYVALLDSDDVWLPSKLARQVEAAEQSGDPGRVLVYSVAEVQRRHETIMRPRRAIAEGEPVADYLFANGGYIAQPTVLFGAAMAREVEYRPGMRQHEDWDLYMRLQRCGVRFIMLPEAPCVVEDRETFGRTSAPRPRTSLATLETWRPMISRRAYLAFRAKVAPELRRDAPMRALTMILEAYVAGAISTFHLAVFIGRLAHPRTEELAFRLRGAVAKCLCRSPQNASGRQAPLGAERNER
jgi:glycosyltransferase involved in cell wall biosynthesis